MRTRTLIRGAAIAAVAGALALGAASPALAHDQLEHTSLDLDPKSGDVTGVTLEFSGDIIEVGTEITVTDADGKSVTDGKPTVEGHEVTQPLASDELAEGEYTAAWRVVSSDGHPVEGAFTIAMGADPSDAAIEEADPRSTDGGESDAEEATESTGSDAKDTNTGGATTGIIIAVGGVVVVLAAVGLLAGSKRRKQAFEGAQGALDADDPDADDPDEEAEK